MNRQQENPAEMVSILLALGSDNAVPHPVQ
jgi:hypothetical protein